MIIKWQSDCPELTQSDWQDVKVQLLTNRLTNLFSVPVTMNYLLEMWTVNKRELGGEFNFFYFLFSSLHKSIR